MRSCDGRKGEVIPTRPRFSLYGKAKDNVFVTLSALSASVHCDDTYPFTLDNRFVSKFALFLLGHREWIYRSICNKIMAGCVLNTSWLLANRYHSEVDENANCN